MTGGDIRIRVLIDNAKGATGLRSQWGLSFWIRRPTARVLLDCGGSGAFLENARRLREPIETADAFVLSHGHYDHGGGVHMLVDAAPSARLVLHPGALVPRWSLQKNGKADRHRPARPQPRRAARGAGALDLGCGAAGGGAGRVGVRAGAAAPSRSRRRSAPSSSTQRVHGPRPGRRRPGRVDRDAGRDWSCSVAARTAAS